MMLRTQTQPTAAGHDSTAPRTLVERAYLALRRDIVHGLHQPSDRLRVEHLKDRYGVGAGTLREALALLVSDALVVAEGQRGFRVTAMSMADLEDVTRTRVMIETEALRQSIRCGGAGWEDALHQAFTRLSRSEGRLRSDAPAEWEAANKAFHETLISACDSAWSKYMLGILHRHSERYRHIALKIGATEAVHRDVHKEHADIYNAAMARQEARAALALESHIRLTCDVLKAHEWSGQTVAGELA
jgi:GntR family transcriptional regulator, carbon starvation induced regulator